MRALQAAPGCGLGGLGRLTPQGRAPAAERPRGARGLGPRGLGAQRSRGTSQYIELPAIPFKGVAAREYLRVL